MRFLLDENLSGRAAEAMTVVGEDEGDEYGHVLQHAPQSTDDDALPRICRDNGFDAIVTVNVRDFGAKKVIYEALLQEGVHVVVIRPGKLTLYLSEQVQLLSGSYRRVRALLASASEPTLVRVNPGGTADPRTVEELAAEFEGGRLP